MLKRKEERVHVLTYLLTGTKTKIRITCFTAGFDFKLLLKNHLEKLPFRCRTRWVIFCLKNRSPLREISPVSSPLRWNALNIWKRFVGRESYRKSREFSK